MGQQDADEFRERAKIDQLSRDERKWLLDELKAHGAETMSAADLRRARILEEKEAADRAKAESKDAPKRTSKAAADDPPTKEDAHQAREAYYVEKKAAKKERAVRKIPFRLGLRAYFAGVKEFMGARLSIKFANTMRTPAKNHVMTLNEVCTTLMTSRTPEEDDAFFTALTKPEAKFYEAFIRSKELYNDAIWERLINRLTIEGNRSASDSMRDLADLYRIIYILYPYSNLASEAIQKAIDLRLSQGAIRPPDATDYAKKANAALRYLFTKFLDQLHLAFLCAIGMDIDRSDVDRMRRSLYWNDKIDSWGALHQSELKSRKLRSSARDDESDENNGDDASSRGQAAAVSPTTALGLQFIEKYPLEDGSLLSETLFAHISMNLSAVRLLSLIHIFEHEFSMILTSSVVDFRLDSASGRSADFSHRMREVYKKLSPLDSITEDFVSACKSVRAVQSDSMARPSAIQQAAQKSDLAYGKLRTACRGFFTELSGLLSEIIVNPAQILEKPEKKIVLEKKFSGKRFIDGQTVIEALAKCNEFLSGALHISAN